MEYETKEMARCAVTRMNHCNFRGSNLQVTWVSTADIIFRFQVSWVSTADISTSILGEHCVYNLQVSWVNTADISNMDMSTMDIIFEYRGLALQI